MAGVWIYRFWSRSFGVELNACDIFAFAAVCGQFLATSSAHSYWVRQEGLFRCGTDSVERSAKEAETKRPCSDFMDMLRRLISCRIIIIIVIIIIKAVHF